MVQFVLLYFEPQTRSLSSAAPAEILFPCVVLFSLNGSHRAFVVTVCGKRWHARPIKDNRIVSACKTPFEGTRKGRAEPVTSQQSQTNTIPSTSGCQGRPHNWTLDGANVNTTLITCFQRNIFHFRQHTGTMVKVERVSSDEQRRPEEIYAETISTRTQIAQSGVRFLLPRKNNSWSPLRCCTLSLRSLQSTISCKTWSLKSPPKISLCMYLISGDYKSCDNFSSPC